MDLISSLQQRFNQLKKETNTLTGETAAKSIAVPDGTKVEAVKQKSNQVETKQEPPGTNKVEPVKHKVESVKVAHSQKVDKLIDTSETTPTSIAIMLQTSSR